MDAQQEIRADAPPRLHFRLAPDPARLARARDRLRDYLSNYCDQRTVDDVVLCVEEAATNAIRHSGSGEEIDIELRFERGDLVALVRDKGAGFDAGGFDPSRLPDPTVDHGRGLFLIAALSDALELSVNHGVTVMIAKHGVPTTTGRRIDAGLAGAHDKQWGGHHCERQRALVEEIHEGFLALDWEYRLIYANAMALDLFGFRADEVPGKPYGELFSRDSATPVEETIRRAMELGAPAMEEFFSPLAGHWLERRVYPTSSGVSIYLRDIDQRKRKEIERDELMAAREAETKQLQVTLVSITDGFCALDEEWRFVYINPAAEEMLGIRRHEVLGKSCWDVFPLTRGTRLEQEYRRAAAGEVRDFEDFYEPWQRWFHNRCFPRPGGGMSVYFRDVTKEREAAAALRESEELLHAVTDNSPDAIYVKDADSRWLMANPALLRIIGRTTQEMLGKTDRDLYADPEIGQAILANDRRILTSGQAEIFEEQADTPDGRRTFLSIKAPRRDASGSIVGLVGISHDITERKRVEEELARQRDEMDHLIRHATTGIYEIDFRQPRFVSVNDFMCTYSGYSRQELLAANPLDLLDEDSRARFRKRIAQALAGEPIEPQVEYCFLTKERERRWAVLNITPTFEGGHMVGAFVVGQDVTERKRTEEALRESENLFRSYVAADSDAVYRMGPDWTEMRSLVGKEFIPDTEHPSRSWLTDYIPECEQARVLAAIDNAIASKCTFELEHQIIQMDGSIGWTHSRAVPVLDANKEIVEWIGAAADITERRRAEEALRESEVRLRQVVDNTTAVILRLDPQAVIRFANKRALELFGYSAEELIGSPALGTIVPERESSGRDLAAMVYEIASNPDSFHSNINENQRKDGKRLWIEWTNSGIYDSEGRLQEFLSVGIDATPRRQAEAALRESEQRYRGLFETLQQGFVHPLPEIPGWEFAAQTQPARTSELIGGDFHDVFVLPTECLAVLIGDVEGKGIAAAGLTETVRSATRTLALSAPSPRLVLTRLNGLLLAQESQLVTALFAVVHRRSGMFTVASAGHPSPLQLHHGEGKVEACRLRPGPPLGAFAESQYVSSVGQIEPGDALVLYTDGVTDARRRGRFFGERGLAEALKDGQLYSAQELAGRLRSAVSKYADELRDDLHILVVQRLSNRRS